MKRLLSLVFLCISQCLSAQTDGDYRTMASGNWNAVTTWQVRTAGSWSPAVETPADTDNVFLQAGHMVTLTGNEGCNDFNISVSSTGTRLSFGANTLSVYGKLRAVTDVPASTGTTDGNIPGIATDQLPGVAAWIKSNTGGGFAIAGITRTVTDANAWEASNAGTTAPNGFELTLTPPAGETFTFSTPLKARRIVIDGAGIVDMGTNRLAPDEGTAGSGDISISGTLKSAGTSSTTNAVVGRIATGTDRYCGAFAMSGTLFLTGSLPFIQAATVTLNGTVVYARNGNQNLLGLPVNNASFPDTYTNLTVEGSGTRTLTGATAVNGALTFTNGRLISTTANLLTMGAGATLPSTPTNGSHVSGPVRKIGNTAFAFPIGKSGVYRPASISASGNVTDVYTAEYFNTPYLVRDRNPSNATPLQHLSGKEYWNVSRDAGTATPDVTLSFNASSGISPGGLTNLVLAHFNGTDWDNLGKTGTTGAASTGGSLTGSTASLSGFSPFTFGTTSTAQPLPVTLLHFRGLPKDGLLELHWLVATEVEEVSYTIEKADSDGFFKAIGAVRSSTENGGRYRFTDGDFELGLQLYRLVLVEASGKQHYSQTLAFEGKATPNIVPAVHPNPVSNILYLQHLKPGVFYHIQNLNGKTLQYFTASRATDKIEVESLPAGIYLLRGSNETVVRFEKR